MMKAAYLLKTDQDSLSYLHRQAGLLQAEGRKASVASVMRTLIDLYQADPEVRKKVRQRLPKTL